MQRNHRRGRLATAVWAGALISCLLTLFFQPLASAKKNKRKERLRSLETVHVTGQGKVAEYVKRNVEKKTCLKSPEEGEAAEAILDVWQHMMPCRSSLSGLCLSASAKLTDGETGKVLWFRTDDDLGSRFSIGVEEAAGKWLLWGLRNACCKGR